MHIDPSTHEHGASGKVYTYEGDFEVGDDTITWQAVISEGGARQRDLAGSIPVSSPALPTLAEQAVRDAIVKCIDVFDDKRGSGAATVDASA